MAFKCGFFNSINGDRLYNAEDMNNPYKRIVSNGVFGDAESSTDFQVLAQNGLEIIVKKGQGIFFDKWSELDSDLPMTIPTPHVSYTRIDSIVIRIDKSDDVRAGSIEYIQGEPSSNPIPTELENSLNIKEYRLAKITIKPNAMSITQAEITDCRPTSECGFIHNLLWDSDISTTYTQWQAQFDEWFENSKNKFDETSVANQNTFDSTQENNQNSFDEWFENSKSDFSSTMTENQKVFDNRQIINQNTFDSTQENNQNAFDEWFNNVKETLSTQTLIQSFTSRYVTKTQDETIIPIQIPEFKSYIDILQVYINGLICIKDVDYTIDGFENIILKNGVDYGTEVSFIVYKSMDGSDIDKYIEDVNDLISRQEQVEVSFENLSSTITSNFEEVDSELIKNQNKVSTLEENLTEVSNDLATTTTKVNTATTNISNLTTKVNTNTSNISNLDSRVDELERVRYSPLWEGANQMGASASITPSKKLDDCRNGWILVWSGYNTSTNKAAETRLQFTYIPKNLMANLTVESMPIYANLIYTYYESGNFDVTAKLVTVTDSTITGFVGNVATDFGKGICLMAVMEW